MLICLEDEGLNILLKNIIEFRNQTFKAQFFKFLNEFLQKLLDNYTLY